MLIGVGRWVTGYDDDAIDVGASDDDDGNDDDNDEDDEKAVPVDDDEYELLAVVCDTGLYGKCEIVF